MTREQLLAMRDRAQKTADEYEVKASVEPNHAVQQSLAMLMGIALIHVKMLNAALDVTP